MPDWFWHFYYTFQRTFTWKIFVTFWELFLLVLPYFVIGIFLAAFLTRFFYHIDKIQLFKKNNFLSLCISAFLGILSPLGTYVVLPIGAVLIKRGFSLPTVIAFVIASPLINPNLIILTAGVLGWPLALARTTSAWLLGVTGGYLIKVLHEKISLTNVIIDDGKVVFKTKRTFINEVLAHIKYITPYFLIALFISSMVRVLVPADWIVKTVGMNKSFSVLIGVGLGVPFYSCGGASIPVMHVLADMGMASGAILAFFIAGPATKLSTLFVFRQTLGTKLLLIYLIITLSGAVILGYLYNAFF